MEAILQGEDDKQRIARLEERMDGILHNQEDSKERSHKQANILQQIQNHLSRQDEKLLQVLEQTKEIVGLKTDVGMLKMREQERSQREANRKGAMRRGGAIVFTAAVTAVFGSDIAQRLINWIYGK